jgi:hypothetical protein
MLLQFMAHLEQDVGGIEVAVADALTVQIFNCGCHLRQDVQHDLPVVSECSGAEEPFCNGVTQAASVAKLLCIIRTTFPIL